VIPLYKDHLDYRDPFMYLCDPLPWITFVKRDPPLISYLSDWSAYIPYIAYSTLWPLYMAGYDTMPLLNVFCP